MTPLELALVIYAVPVLGGGYAVWLASRESKPKPYNWEEDNDISRS